MLIKYYKYLVAGEMNRLDRLYYRKKKNKDESRINPLNYKIRNDL